MHTKYSKWLKCICYIWIDLLAVTAIKIEPTRNTEIRHAPKQLTSRARPVGNSVKMRGGWEHVISSEWKLLCRNRVMDLLHHASHSPHSAHATHTAHSSRSGGSLFLDFCHHGFSGSEKGSHATGISQSAPDNLKYKNNCWMASYKTLTLIKVSPVSGIPCLFMCRKRLLCWDIEISVEFVRSRIVSKFEMFHLPWWDQ